MNIILYIFEFIVIGILVNFSLGTQEQMITTFDGSLLIRFMVKFCYVSITVALLSGIMLLLYYLSNRDKIRFKKLCVQHTVFILVFTVLCLLIQLYNSGYV